MPRPARARIRRAQPCCRRAALRVVVDIHAYVIPGRLAVHRRQVCDDRAWRGGWRVSAWCLLFSPGVF